jgi:hypothetical protein
MIELVYASWDCLSPSIFEYFRGLEPFAALQPAPRVHLHPIKPLQKIEMAVGDMLHRLNKHCTKLVPDSFLDDVVQCRCFVTE